MAQLRDALTGELLAEGTPFQVIVAAAEVGRDNVMFDDVGTRFDPAAIRAAYESDIEGLTAVVADRSLPAQVRQDAGARRDRLVRRAAAARDAAPAIARVRDSAQPGRQTLPPVDLETNGAPPA